MQLVKDAAGQSFSAQQKYKKLKMKKAFCYTAIHVIHRKPSNQGAGSETF